MLRGQSLATDEIDANNDDAKTIERAGITNDSVQTQSAETD